MRPVLMLPLSCVDMDDLHNSSTTHLAVITVPAAIAMGERMGKGGQDIINAVVAGYDVGAELEMLLTLQPIGLAYHRDCR